MQRLGLPLHVNAVNKQQLVSILLDAGFDIDLEWWPGKGSVSVVAIRRQDDRWAVAHRLNECRGDRRAVR